jgi:octaprenyl-diphosphate synthase
LVAHELAAAERLFCESLQSSHSELSEQTEYVGRSGGKRVRAILVLLVAKAANHSIGSAIRLACAAELIHAASLCHDDVIDEESTRRGGPTLRTVYGDATSVLVGDLCIARAFEALSDQDVWQASRTLAATISAMAEGELLQLRPRSLDADPLDDYMRIARRKTGQLFAWCSSLGGLLPQPTLDALHEYGCQLGLAYQIADDLQDVSHTDWNPKNDAEDRSNPANLYPALRNRSIDGSVQSASGIKAAIEACTAAACNASTSAIRNLCVLAPSPYRSALECLAHIAAMHR